MAKPGRPKVLEDRRPRLQAVAKGQLAPEEGEGMMALLESYRLFVNLPEFLGVEYYHAPALRTSAAQ